MVLVGCGPTTVVTSTDASTGTAVAISTATPTTGDGGSNAVPSPDLPEVACAALCAAEARCREVPVQPECVPDCVAGLGDGPGDEPACSATDALLTACRAELACEVLLDEGGYRACEPELLAMLTACGLCMFDYGWIDADTCYLDDLCPNGHHRIECDAQTCVCTHDGMFLGSCPSQGSLVEEFEVVLGVALAEPRAILRRHDDDGAAGVVADLERYVGADQIESALE